MHVFCLVEHSLLHAVKWLILLLGDSYILASRDRIVDQQPQVLFH